MYIRGVTVATKEPSLSPSLALNSFIHPTQSSWLYRAHIAGATDRPTHHLPATKKSSRKNAPISVTNRTYFRSFLFVILVFICSFTHDLLRSLPFSVGSSIFLIQIANLHCDSYLIKIATSDGGPFVALTCTFRCWRI